jgi:hypothetical protein
MTEYNFKKRKTKKEKRKNTFNMYGKYTVRGARIKEETILNHEKNKRSKGHMKLLNQEKKNRRNKINK